MMEFAKPEAFVWLWIIPLALLLIIGAERLRRQRLARFSGQSVFAALGIQLLRGRTILKGLLLVGALSCLVIALAGPRLGFVWIENNQFGSDIMVVLDISKSMLAQDADPSRLERAKRKVEDVISRLRGDRMGLVVYAGTAFPQCPLTEDLGAMQLFLSHADPKIMPVQGTDLGEAFRVALKSLKSAATTTSKQAVLLITDGEDHEGGAAEAVKLVQDAGVKLFVLGVGRPEGAPIPDGDGFKKDSSGNLVISRLNEPFLKNLATSANGLYVRSVASDEDVKALYDQGIKKLVEQDAYKSTKQKLWTERFQWFLAAAFFMLLLEACLKDVRVAASASILVFSLLSLGAPKAEASESRKAHESFSRGKYDEASKEFLQAEIDDPQRGHVHAYNRAVSEYKAGNYQAAAEGFDKLTKTSDPELAQHSWFNLGNARVGSGELDKAAEAYEQALKLKPNDQAAKDNLSYAMALKQQQKQQESQQQQSKEKQQQEQQGDQKGQEQNKPQQNQSGQGQEQQQSQNGQGQEQQGDQKGQEQNKPQQNQSAQGQEPQQNQSGQGQNNQQQDQNGPEKQQAQPPEPAAGQGDSKPIGEEKKADGSADAQDQKAEKAPNPSGARSRQGAAPGDMTAAEAESVLRAADDQGGRFLRVPSTSTRRPNKDW